MGRAEGGGRLWPPLPWPPSCRWMVEEQLLGEGVGVQMVVEVWEKVAEEVPASQPGPEGVAGMAEEQVPAPPPLPEGA